MRKILCLSPYVSEPITHGGSIRTSVLLAALQGLGEVHHAVPVANEAEQRDAERLARRLGLVLQPLPHRDARARDPVRKLANWARGRSDLLARRWPASALARVAALLREHDFDLVVADGSHVLPLLPRAPRRLLLHLHNVEAAVLARKGDATRPLRERVTRTIETLRIARTERKALQDAALTIVVSTVDANLAVRLCPEANVVTIPNSVDLAHLPYRPRPAREPARLLFVGRLDYPPNHEAVAELVDRHLPVLRQSFPGLSVRIAGEDRSGSCARFAGQTGVEFLGRVDDLLPLYATSDATYVPLRSGGGTRLKLLEAFALGLPVASTVVAAEGLDVRDGVHLRTFDTPEQGVEALRGLFGDARKPTQTAARQLVEREYSHAIAIARMRRACEEALAAPSLRSAR